MPSRILREAYVTSGRIDAVSPAARDCWVRLLLNVDDFGRFHGDPRIVASKCFPLRANARNCQQMLAELAAVGLIVRYEQEGKQYLALTQWNERVRTKPKYPAPPDCQQPADRCAQTADNCQPPSYSPSPSNSPSPSASSAIAFDAEHGWSGVTDADLAAWREAYPAIDVPAQLAAAREWAKANPKQRKSNWRRFITGWLGRSQDRARPGVRSAPDAPRRVAL